MPCRLPLLFSIGALTVAALMASCRPETPPNPYDDLPPVVDTDGLVVPPLPEGNFAWLHQQVFAPTCANSGCHDGTFEPDFRTVGSAWNTLVNHPVIANDAAMSFNRRVVPGSVSNSFLFERLTVNIPNTPLSKWGFCDVESDRRKPTTRPFKHYRPGPPTPSSAWEPAARSMTPSKSATYEPPVPCLKIKFPCPI